ncbi:hypothetical protein MMC07_008588 [Pseudocyphellaria aurata]|nr:hypothetical protein [Pseudocyphellaria aurata]
MAELSPPPPQSPSAFVYLNDYPKSWKRSMIGNDPFPVVTRRPVKVSDVFRGRADDDRRLLSYFDHDTRARAARECFQHAKTLYGGAGPTYPEVTESALDAVRAKIFDPLKYSFPRWFTREAAAPTRPVHGRLPIIRAGVTSYEDLLTLIQDVKRIDPHAEVQLPTHRDYGKSSWYGLPRHLGPTNTEDHSFELPETREPRSPVPPPRLDRMTRQAKSKISAAERKRREDIRVLYLDWRHQRRLNQAQGRAAETRFNDIFDPRGRIYRRHWQETKNGQVWQSPPPAGAAIDSEPSATGDYAASSDPEDSDEERSKRAILKEQEAQEAQERPAKRSKW